MKRRDHLNVSVFGRIETEIGDQWSSGMRPAPVCNLEHERNLSPANPLKIVALQAQYHRSLEMFLTFVCITGLARHATQDILTDTALVWREIPVG
jgi:hypothetical protein